MNDIVMFIISIISLIVEFLLIVKLVIKKYKSNEEKLIDVIVLIILTTLIIIYYFDRYNIPSKLNLDVNVNTQNWLSIIGDYVTGIISSGIGAIVAVWTTLYQVRKNNEENNERDAENLRIQNMPLIKYSFNSHEDCESNLKNLITTKTDEGLNYNLNFNLKNIGLNNIKKLRVSFESDVFCSNKVEVLGKNSIVALEKGEEISIKNFFSLKSSNTPYKIEITINYEDVLCNWYEQIINVEYMATNIYEKGRPIGIVNHIVNEEKMIEKIIDVKGEEI